MQVKKSIVLRDFFQSSDAGCYFEIIVVYSTSSILDKGSLAAHLPLISLAKSPKNKKVSSSTYITTSGGNEYQFLQYLPYGGIFVEQKDAGLSVPYLFNSYEADDESGFYYAVNRYYNPEFGFFVSTDQMSDAAPNMTPYRFCFNNPLRYTDPTGNFETEGLDDWVETSSGAIIYDAGVTDKYSAQQRYGVNAKYLGKEATIMGSDGTQISLNSNGHATSSAWLDKIDNGNMVTVSASRINSTEDKVSTASSLGTYGLGTYMAMNNQVDAITNTTNPSTKSIGKYGGGALSTASIFASAKSLFKNPSPGGVFNLTYDIIASRQENPYAMIGITAIDLIGGKESTAKALNQIGELINYTQLINADKVMIKRVK